MSFFKTAKSTFMSSNGQSSNQAWLSQYGGDYRPPKRDNKENKSVIGSDLAGNADQIIAGGTMSILRRKGKRHNKR